MKKSELIERLTRHHAGVPHQRIKEAVEALAAQMTETLAGGERIEIRGFGSFSLHLRPPRIGRNPKNGAPVTIPERRAVHFKPGKELRNRVNNGHHT